MMRMLALVLAATTIAAQELPFNQRPADVRIVMSTSRGLYDGEYTFSQIAQVCGEVPKDRNFSGVPAFIVQFPDDAGSGQVTDVSFDSKTLVGGVTTTTTFHLNVSVKSPKIGSPNAYVLDTERPKMTGTATLSTPSPGTTQLKVVGVNDLGQTIDLTLRCRPRGSR
jgi:hypothetical protein